MAFPFVLSPYLRPLLEGGVLVIDNPLTQRLERLGELELALVRALWEAGRAEDEVAALLAEHGEEALLAALRALIGRALAFPDREACDELLDQLLGQGQPAVPFVDQVELTNRCPMRCRFCPRGRPGEVTRPEGLMSLELFRRLLDQLNPAQRSYRPLELHHLGESLLHPAVHRFVEEASRRGLPTELSVNPSLLDPERARRLLGAGLRRLVLSLDGLDDETLTSLRGPAASYGRAEANLEALLGLVAASSDPPRVVIQMLDLERNRHQREAFLERWGASGLATVTAFVKPLDGIDPDRGGPSAEPLAHLCAYPFRSVVVLWDGRVVPCCRDADAALVLGDLTEASLERIWHGASAEALRAAHRGGRPPAGHLCAGCAWSRERYAETMPLRHPDRARPDPLRW